VFGIRTLRGQRAVFLPGCGAGHAGRGGSHTDRAARRKRRLPARLATGTGEAERAAVAPGGMLGNENENHRDDARMQATETRLREARAAVA